MDLAVRQLRSVQAQRRAAVAATAPLPLPDSGNVIGTVLDTQVLKNGQSVTEQLRCNVAAEVTLVADTPTAPISALGKRMTLTLGIGNEMELAIRELKAAQAQRRASVAATAPPALPNAGSVMGMSLVGGDSHSVVDVEYHRTQCVADTAPQLTAPQVTDHSQLSISSK